MKKIKLSFSVKIFLGLLAGIIVGALFTDKSHLLSIGIKPFGDAFLNLIRFIVTPVVFLTVMSGILSMKSAGDVKKIGGRTIVFYLFTTAAAVVVGLLLARLFYPLFPPLSTKGLSWNGATTVDFLEPLLNIIPSNLFSAFAAGDMLQVIFAAVLFGMAILKLPNRPGENMVRKGEKVAICVMEMILKVSPVGVFALIAPTIAQTGYKALGSLLMVVLCVYLAFLLHIVLVYMPLVYFKRKLSPVRFIRNMLPALLLAFSTASSVSAMSQNLKCAKKLGADEGVADFVIPLGATLNMDGTGIYQGVCVTFIAACFGLELTIAQCAVVTVCATLASVGTAGVPGAGMIMLAVALESIGLPVEGIALVAGIDRIFDMGRTAVNILGDSTCALFVGPKSQSEIKS